MGDPEKIVELPSVTKKDDEQFHRVTAEAERLANQSEAERAFFIPKCAEALGVPVMTLKATVHAVLRERSNRTAAERLEQDRARKRQEERRVAEQRDQDRIRKEEARERQRAKKEEEREEKRLAKEREQEKRKADKEAERKAKDKAKTFGNLAKLPVAHRDKELKRLAERLGEDIMALRKEFVEFLGVDGGEPSAETEPWPDPVDTAILLREVGDKISRYVILQEHQLTATVLWNAHTWLYDHGVPTHSPLLVPSSAEPDSGKTTLVAVLGRATPRFSLNIEMTGPSLYRFVDAVKPTLGIDEADDLFARKSDLKHIINAGWTRGAKIPRQVNIAGIWTTVYFDPFTPKIVALLGRNLPPATRSRSIELRMLPKRPDEQAELFNQLDDAEFAVLRSKFARWAIDNAAALTDAKPTMPVGLNNRAAANWRLLLAIAELAGAAWPRQARKAAERLSRSGRQPSVGVKLLTAIKAMFAEIDNKVIASKTIIVELIKDPTDIWVAYNHGGAVTQRQVAHLLSDYDITPDTVHPSGLSADSPKGYKYQQTTDAFARYVPVDPHIRTRKKAKSGKPKNQRKKRLCADVRIGDLVTEASTCRKFRWPRDGLGTGCNRAPPGSGTPKRITARPRPRSSGTPIPKSSHANEGGMILWTQPISTPNSGKSRCVSGRATYSLKNLSDRTE